MRERGRRRRRTILALLASLAGIGLLAPLRRAPAPVPAPAEAVAPLPVAPSALAAKPPLPPAAPPSYQDFLDALTREFPFGRERQSVLREMLEGAPPEAVEALLRLSFGEETLNDISHVLIERLAFLAPEAALAFAREKQFGVDPPWWHSVIGGLSDPRAALGDLLTLPASDERTRFLGHLVFQLGAENPDAAMDFALSAVPPEARETAVANVVFAASRRDFSDGFDLALLYAPTAGDPGLVRRIAIDWAMHDYEAAAARIRALDEGAARQAAWTGLAAAAISRDPAGALELIAQVRDAATREALLVDAGKQLWLKDPAAAAVWLEENPELSAASKETLREFAKRVGGPTD